MVFSSMKDDTYLRGCLLICRFTHLHFVFRCAMIVVRSLFLFYLLFENKSMQNNPARLPLFCGCVLRLGPYKRVNYLREKDLCCAADDDVDDGSV